MDRKKGVYSVQAVVKAFDLLEAIATDDSDTSIPALAKRLELSRNKLFRLFATLEDKELIERDKTTGTYKLGLYAFEMAQKVLKSVSFIRLARPIIEELAHKHDEAVYFAVMNNDEILFLDMVDTFQQIKTIPLVGQRFQFFTNAAGKAIKAMSSSDVLDKIGIRRAIKAGITDLHKLELELNDIRTKGVAVDFGGLGEGVCTVAVAIRDYSGRVVGALTMLAPSFRMLQERLDKEIIPSMLDGAVALSMRFGYAKITA